MLDRRQLLACAAAASLSAPALAAPPSAETSQGRKLTALLDAFWAEELQRGPERATDLGLDTGANAPLKHRLTDVSAAGIEGDRAEAAHQARRLAAFDLHQATERLYHCLLLVLTLYSPKSHKLNFLRSQCEQHVPALVEAWPRETRFQQRSFELLRRAYVDARYSPHYKITAEELAWLGERVAILQRLVRNACDLRLAGLKSETRG